MSIKVEVPNRDYLYNLYFTDNLRLVDLADKFNVSTTTIKGWFRFYSFPNKDKKLCIKNKETTCLTKYGCVNPASSKEVRDKIRKTNLDKFGTESPLSSKEVRDKIKSTIKDKYGVDYVGQSKEVREKIKKSTKERFGVDNLFKDKGYIQSKVQEKYGVKSNLEREDVKEKIKDTNLERYGVENVFASDEIKQRIHKFYQSNYGVDNSSQIKLSDRTKDILFNKDKFVEYIRNFDNLNAKVIADDLGIDCITLHNYVKKYELDVKFNFTRSSYETEISKLFSNTFRYDRTVIKPYEIDLYSPEHKLGIEFNGNYWHNENHKDSLYHQNKSLLAKDKGVFLYHIFEYEWADERKRNIIISQLKNLLKLNTFYVYTRKTVLKEVSNKEARQFLNTNHLQGHCNAKVSLGLYYNNELVSLMTFGKPRFNKEYDWELLRFCNKLNTTVVGASSRLFKHFVSVYKPKSVLSYSNIAKATGKMYEMLGFKFKGITHPNYSWTKNIKVLSRYQCQKSVLIKQGFDKNKTEDEIMRDRKYSKIYDCGNIVWDLKF